MFLNPIFALMFILLPLVMIIMLFAVQFRVRRVFNNASTILSKSNYTGRDVAEAILRKNNCSCTIIVGESNFFNPRNNTIVLTSDVYSGTSLKALAVASHEVGHVIQMNKKSIWLTIRTKIIPFVQFTTNIAWIALLIGAFSSIIMIFAQNTRAGSSLWYFSIFMFFIGLVGLFAITLWNLVQLPVEFDASNKAMKNLISLEIIKNNDEKVIVKKVLNAAALTYIVSFIISLLMFLRQLWWLIAVSWR